MWVCGCTRHAHCDIENPDPTASLSILFETFLPDIELNSWPSLIGTITRARKKNHWRVQLPPHTITTGMMFPCSCATAYTARLKSSGTLTLEAGDSEQIHFRNFRVTIFRDSICREAFSFGAREALLRRRFSRASRTFERQCTTLVQECHPPGNVTETT